MMLDYFYGQSGELFAYFRIPKALFQDSRFRQLSTDARTLYGILLDRMSLSAKNSWVDEHGRVYIIYTVREVQESLCCAEHKAVKLFRELEQADLIERKRRGLGRPSLIYVKNFSSGLPKAQIQNCANSNSCAAESAVQVRPKSQSNKTDKNKTEKNHPFLPDETDRLTQREQLEDYFYQALEVELLLRLCPDDEDAIYQIVDLLVDTCSTKRKMLRIAGDDKPVEVVRSRLKKLNADHMYNHYVRDGFGKLRISKIKYSDIKKFYYSLILEKGFKPNSMEIVHTLLHPTFTMAVRDGLLRLNPTEGVMAEIKKSHCWEKTKRHALTVAEQRAFTNYIANSEEYRGWFPLFTVMLGTGCRIGEVLGLRWQDVDFKNRTISINHNLVYRVQEDGTCTNHVNSPKTKAGIRIIPMIDEVFDAFLEEYQYQKVIGFCTDEIDGYSGFVFCTGDGKVYLPNAINRTIRSICADYNKEEESKAKEENRDPVLLPKFSCHILRHTFCTRFCENETNLKVIQEIMGHADISTTMDVYAEATQEKKKESMASLQSALLVR